MIKPIVRRVDFDIKVKLNGVDLVAIKAEIESALINYFNRLIPADSLIVSQCEAIVSDLIGVVDRRIVSPSVNLHADIISGVEWFRFGQVNVELMQ